MNNKSIVQYLSYRVTRLSSLVLLGYLLCSSLVQATKTYQTSSDFLKESFQGKPPATSLIAINAEMKSRITRMNGGIGYGQSRVRYWTKGDTSVWILEDIGKTRPITTGYVVKSGKIQAVKVLVYRESHGGEVAQTFFTRQLKKVSLKSNSRLSKRPSNIAGATLSVRSLTRMSRVALYLDQQRKSK